MTPSAFCFRPVRGTRHAGTPSNFVAPACELRNLRRRVPLSDGSSRQNRHCTGIIAATIFAFTVSWAAFVYPMAFLYSSDQLVLTVGTVTSLIRADVYKWGMLMAGALVAIAPPLIIYAFLMDYYIAGLTAGATKG
jgi:hypothetical protein